MTNFKVGDRVRDLAAPRRGEGTVRAVSPGVKVSVRFDKYGSYASDTDTHTRAPEKIELVETALASQAREYREAAEPKSDLEKVAESLIAEGKITGSAPIRTHVIEDDVNHPSHYNSGKIEVWDFIYDQGLGYALGNATKYITRAGKKAGNSKVKDLRKAVAFLEREIRFEETGE